jgi:hypothetical protein
MNKRSARSISLLIALSMGAQAFAGPATLQAAPVAVTTVRQAATVAATVVMITGRGLALSADGSLRALVAGSPVFEGELVSTGPSTYLNLKFADQSLFLLRPNTRFQIEEFSHEPPAAAAEPLALAPARRTLTASVTPPRTDTAFFRLLKGGFRAVTGAVGKSERERFRVATPVATIGIRGTDFETRWCDRDCDDAGLDEKDGLGAFVHDGGVEVTGSRPTPALGFVQSRAWPGYSGMTRLESLMPQTLDPSVAPLASFYFAGEETIALLGIEMPLETGVGILLVGGSLIVGGVGAGIYAYRENEQDDREDRHSMSVVVTENRPSMMNPAVTNPASCASP